MHLAVFYTNRELYSLYVAVKMLMLHHNFFSVSQVSLLLLVHHHYFPFFQILIKAH